jgi:G protein-coupled receptor Mth (Methuselah protein)
MAPYSYVIWGINNRPVGGCSSEIQSHYVDINNNKKPLVDAVFDMSVMDVLLGITQQQLSNQTNFVSRATLGRVCLKLVVVMGLTWVADVVSWVVGGPHYIWYVTDLINTLQGVFIFVVAGCQPQVWSAINRLWCLRPQRTQRTNMGHHLSLYSQGPPSLGDSVTNNHSTKSAHLETLC